MDEKLEIGKKVKEALDQKMIRNQQLDNLEIGVWHMKELFEHAENPEHDKDLSNKINQKLKILEKEKADKKSSASGAKKNRKKTVNFIQEHYEKKLTCAPEEYNKKTLKITKQMLFNEDLTLDEILKNRKEDLERIQKTFLFKEKQSDVIKCQLITKAISNERIELSHKYNLTSMEIRYIERDLKKELKTSKN